MKRQLMGSYDYLTNIEVMWCFLND